jgi:predicted DNA-binding protein
MKPPKRSTSFRLDDETLSLLDAMARRLDMTKAAVLKRLIHNPSLSIFAAVEASERQRHADNPKDPS